jgi:hypothetical protein
VNNKDHRRFLSNFFMTSQIGTMRQMCQLIVDHSQAFDSRLNSTSLRLSLKSFIRLLDLSGSIKKDTDLSQVIKQYIIRFIVQCVSDLPSLATSYLILSLIPSSTSLLENTRITTDVQFQELINNLCPLTLTGDLTELQQLLAQINTSCQTANEIEYRGHCH